MTVLENVAGRPCMRALTTGPLGRRSCARRAAGPRRREARGAGASRSSAIFGNRLTAAHQPAGRRSCPTPIAAGSRSPARWPRGRSVLLLDEPTAGMNPAETLELADQIKSLHATGADRPPDRAQAERRQRLADKVIVLDHGEKIAEGTPSEVRRNEEVLRAYLGRNAQDRERPQLLEFRGRQHLLRRAARPEGRELHDRRGRDRLPARRQRLAASPPP